MGHQDLGRQHRLDAGLCFRCGKAPHLAGRTRCEACAEKDSQRSRKERGAAMQSQIAGQVKVAAHDRTPFNKMPVVRPVVRPRVIVIQDKNSDAAVRELMLPQKREVPVRGESNLVLW